MSEDRFRQEAREMLRGLPEDERARLLEPAKQVVQDRNPGVEASEIVVEGLGLEEVAEEIVVRWMALGLGDASARIREHVTKEHYRRWMIEEMRRLSAEFPVVVPEEALVDAVYARMKQEFPHL
jgi:hypothetical protein